ncbi:SMEK domain-containing protein [Nitratireductor sp. CH_MIT9313-5]|uniref:SMEK domain-containing protein n=1 Tax=Nitratireductor sp. CH_MIT9313-5 TaxID=3107764 RepID=UPI00300A33BB
MRQLTVENSLREVITRLERQVELATAQGRTDINSALEDAFIPILKATYNLPNLVNLNRKRKNYPGIDLGDDHDRVAFQITSTTTLDKVKSTVQQFMDRAYYNSFDELFVLMLTPKQSSYKQAAIDGLLTDQLSFNCKKHIIDLGDLLREVSALRVTAQERILREFEHILGETEAFISFSAETIETPTTITSNLQAIELPASVYVAELTIDDKAVITRAKAELNYGGRSTNRRSTIKMALLLEDVETDAWVYYDGRIFAFEDMEQTGVAAIIDAGSIERLDVADLSDSPEIENVNILKQLLVAQTQERLKGKQVRLHSKDRFFFFGPSLEGQKERKEAWIGKKRSERRVYKVIQQKKDPTKVAHHQHLSFGLSFIRFEDAWYAEIVPSWYYSFNGYRRSNWHEDLLSKQKRQEHNSTVRDQVRFVAYFLASLTEDGVGTSDIRYRSLIEFETNQGAEAEALLNEVEGVVEENGDGPDEVAA